METLHEIIPFAKEMMSQKPRRGLVKLYLVGTVLAFFGLVIGLVETVCQPFMREEPMDEELALLIAQEHRLQKRAELDIEPKQTSAAAEDGVVSKQQVLVRRNSAIRLHAS